MKAIAVFPRRPGSVHLAEVPTPRLDEVPNGRGVLVQVLRVGICGTDREIMAGEYGEAPAGSDVLVLGHESLGRVVAVGPRVTELSPGEYVVATVRRPGDTRYDRIGLSDFNHNGTYTERGIKGLHGFLAEHYVEDAGYLVRVPASLRDIGALLEPMTIAEKGVSQAYEIQRRLQVWQPERAVVLGAGAIGLLSTILLRLRGLQVFTLARTRRPHLNADLAEACGATYVSIQDTTLMEVAARYGPLDIIFEATGSSPLAFEAMEALGNNGVLILSSITGGYRRVDVPSDRINLGMVLGNKVVLGTVNASRANFEQGVRDLVLAEATWPHLLGRLFTHSVPGLESYQEMVSVLTNARSVIKVVVEVSPAE